MKQRVIVASLLCLSLSACGQEADLTPDEAPQTPEPDASVDLSTGGGDMSSPTNDPPDQAGPKQEEPPRDPVPVNLDGAKGERGQCGFADDTQKRLSGLECQAQSLPGTKHEYCVMAHPDCANADERCPVFIMFNQGTPLGSSATFRSRVGRPELYGKIVVVGGGTSADNDVMAELPRQLLKDYPGIDPLRVYALGNSRGAGAINQIFARNDSTYGTTWDVYAGVVVFGGGLKIPETFNHEGNLHALVVNGQKDKPEPGDAAALAKINGCDQLQADWRNVSSDDPLMPGGDGTDIASKLTFGQCPRGDVLAYRFKDEGHVLDYTKHFNPKVRAIYMAWDFFQGRMREGGLQGQGSACYASD